MIEMWDIFFTEATEKLQEVEDILLKIDKDGYSSQDIDTIYRALHTFKGSSGLMGLSHLGGLAHHTEDLVGLVRDEGVPMAQPIIDVLFTSLDTFRQMAQEVVNSHQDVSLDSTTNLSLQLQAVLQQYRPNGSGEATAEPEPLPEAVATAEQPAMEMDTLFVPMLQADQQRLLKQLEAFKQQSPDALALATEIITQWLFAAEQLGEKDYLPFFERLNQMLQAGQIEAFILELQQFAPDTPVAVQDAPSPEAMAPHTATPVLAATAAPAAEGVTNVSANAPKTQNQYLKVDSQKINLLMDLAGEIGLVANTVMSHPELSELDVPGFRIAAQSLHNLIHQMQSETSSLRMVPMSDLFNRIRRLTRDLARETGKEVELIIEGEDTEIDKLMVDRLYEPLVHMVRNAMDHGIESRATRIEQGKAPTAKIMLRAIHQTSEVMISLEDDGKGLDKEAILKRGRERGLVQPDETPDEKNLFNLIFHPGFSTAAQLTSLSGRGVGMDVVQHTIQELRGRISISSKPGKGTRIAIFLPLTLAFIESMIVEVSQKFFAIPVTSVIEVVQASPDQIVHVTAEQKQLIRLRDKLIPLHWLQQFYHEPHAFGTHHPNGNRNLYIIAYSSHGEMAIPVDHLYGNQQITIKPLSGLLQSIRAGAGYGILSSGDVAIVLDCERLNGT